jgi:hypothetical protein
MDESILVSTGKALDFSEPLILFKSVYAPVFEYYGWSDVLDRPSEDRPLTSPRWTEQYDAVVAFFAPLKARLSFKNALGDYVIVSTLAGQSDEIVGRYQVGPDDCNC